MKLYVVRLWDGMDGTWTDVSSPLSKQNARKVYMDKTKGGTKNVSYSEIDYYRIFDANSTMHYSNGKSLRGGRE